MRLAVDDSFKSLSLLSGTGLHKTLVFGSICLTHVCVLTFSVWHFTAADITHEALQVT